MSKRLGLLAISTVIIVFIGFGGMMTRSEVPNGSAESRVITVWTASSDADIFSIHSPANIIGTAFPPVFGRLFISDSNFNLQPRAITSWNWSEEHQGFVLTLRKRMRFHNGRTVTIEDLEFSIIRGLLSTSPNFFPMFLASLVGFDKIKGKEFKSGICDGIKIIDDNSLVLKTTNKSPLILYNLSVSVFGLVPHEEMLSDYFSFKNKPVGAGSYRVVEYTGKSAVLEKVADHYLARSASPQKFIIKNSATEPEHYDVAFSFLRPASRPLYATIENGVPASIYGAHFNNENPLALKKVVRQAIAALLNPKALCSVAPGNRPLNSLFPGSLWREESAVAQPEFLPEAREAIASTPLEVLYYSSTLEDPSIKARSEAIAKIFAENNLIYRPQASLSKFQTEPELKSHLFSLAGTILQYSDPLSHLIAVMDNSPYKRNILPKPILENVKPLHAEYEAAEDWNKKIEVGRKIANLIQDEYWIIPICEQYNEFYYNTQAIKSLGEQNQPIGVNLEQIEVGQ